MAVSSLARPKVGVIAATGGTVFDLPLAERGVLMRVHRFTSSSNFVVSAGAGLVEVLLQAGGGGGGGNQGRGAAGGGAGGFLLETTAVSIDTYAIVVGNGGSGGATTPANGSNGANTTGFGFAATGGGGGARHTADIVIQDGLDGGSGGGGKVGGRGVDGQGSTATTNSAGGLSITLAFDGVQRVYSSPGAPGSRTGNTTAQRQRSVFGQGGQGGSGDSTNSAGGQGGSGILIVRYPVRRL